jgi:hypothetical protein
VSTRASKTERKNKTEPPRMSDSGPSLFGHFYFALFIWASTLAYTVYGTRESGLLWIQVFAGIFALLCFVGALARDLFHDWFASMSMAGKVWYFLLVIAAFCAPELPRGHDAMPEGFVTALVPLMPFAGAEPVARLTIALMIAGCYLALPDSPLPSPYSFLVLGGGALWVMGAAHFAFTGRPYRLQGWWPARRVIGNSIVYFVPSAIAAILGYYLWPSIAPIPVQPPVTEPIPEFRRAEPLNYTELLMDTAIYVGLIFASLITLHLLRRFFSRRARPPALPDVRLVNVSDVELRAADEAVQRAGLPGNRGKIVDLWWRWAQRAEVETGAAGMGAARTPGETAAETAERIATESEPEEIPLEITRLMEIAHYGPEEPSKAEVEAMRNLVNEDRKKPG